MGKIIAFANQKGGVGKTTTCVNVGAYMAAMGKRVLLVDLDPQGNATSNFGVEKEGEIPSVYDLLCDETAIEDVVRRTDIPKLDIIPSEINLAGAEIELVQMDNRESILKKQLNKIRNSYDYICIDCAPSIGLLTINALTACDSVIIPIQCEFFALEGLSQLMNTIALVIKHLNSKLKVEGVVLTMRDARSNLVNEVSDEIRKFFKDKVYDAVIPRNIRLAEAPSYGKPILTYDPKSKGAFAYLLLTQEILRRNQDTYLPIEQFYLAMNSKNK